MILRVRQHYGVGGPELVPVWMSPPRYPRGPEVPPGGPRSRSLRTAGIAERNARTRPVEGQTPPGRADSPNGATDDLGMSRKHTRCTVSTVGRTPAVPVWAAAVYLVRGYANVRSRGDRRRKTTAEIGHGGSVGRALGTAVPRAVGGEAIAFGVRAGTAPAHRQCTRTGHRKAPDFMTTLSTNRPFGGSLKSRLPV